MRAPRIVIGLVWLALFGAAGRLAAQDGSVRWKPMVGQFVYASPAVTADGNTIYIAAWYDTQPNRGVVRALNRDGSQKWQFPKTTDAVQIDRVESSPAIGPDGTVYFGCGDGKIYALDPNTGLKKAEFVSGALEINNSPAIDADGNVYIVSSDLVLHALTRDLKPRWTHIAGYSFSIDTSASIGIDGTIYIGASDNNIYAINPADGKDRWLVSVGAAILTSPVIGPDGTIYVGLTDNTLAAVTRDGVRWKFPVGDQILAAPSLAADGTIYFGAADNLFYALKPDGTLKWAPLDIRAGIFTTPAVRGDGTIIFGANDNLVHAINPDRSPKWTAKTDDVVQSSPVIAADGSIYVGSGDGRLYAINGTTAPASPLSSFSSWPMFNHDAAHSGRTSATTPGAYLVNLSTLTRAGGNANLIVGFVTQGQASKRFLIRAVGPTLGSGKFNIPGMLADPAVSVVFAPTGAEIAANDDWSGADQQNFREVVNATINTFTLQAGFKDAAVAPSLAPGRYSAVLKATDGGTGLALVEAYDVEVASPGSRLINLSTRAQAGSGAGVLTAGFVIQGQGTLRVLLRAIGPGLAQFGVGGFLARPSMLLYDSNSTPIGGNAGWTSGGLTEDLAVAARLTGAFPLSASGAGSADCAGVFTLSPGTYTVQVSGLADTSGEALVEVYVVP